MSTVTKKELVERIARVTPANMDKVQVPAKKTVKFKMGRIMKERVNGKAAE